jgi:thiopurine S-methyltransferase
MDANFWHKKWESNNIGFHQKHVHPLLVEHFKALELPKGSRVFVPLCGKTLDIGWLLDQGYQVAGVELSELAIKQLFAELGITPNIIISNTIKHYHARNIDIFVGDIFHVTPAMLGKIDAIFDRAALVALPASARADYAQHLITITDSAPQLLISYDYDQSIMQGPPFSVTEDELNQHYQSHYQIDCLSSLDEVLRETHTIQENVWLLTAT